MKYKIEVQTVQNVSIEFEKASFKDRFFAKAIDGGILVVYLSILVIAAAILIFNNAASRFLENIFEDVILVTLLLITLLILLIPYIFYSPLFESLNGGQTPGKKIMKIKVVMLDGSPLRLSAILLRWLFSLIDNFFYCIPGIISVLTSPIGQRIGDKIAKTVVVTLSNNVTLSDTIYADLDPNYIVKYPEAKNLKSSDIEVIKQVLMVDSMRYNHSLVLNLANKIQNDLQISSKELPADFLDTIIKDYYHIS